MAAYRGLTALAAIYLGTTAIAAVYHGTTEVWSATLPDAVMTRTVTLVSFSSVSSNSAVRSIGTASAKRIVAVAVGWEASGVTLTSVTIDGTPMNLVEQEGGNTGAAIAWLPWPTGTTATIAITLSGAASGGLEVWSIENVNGLFDSAIDQRTSTGTSLSATIDTALGGALLALAVSSGSTNTFAWTGSTEQSDADASNMRFSSARSVPTAAATGAGLTANYGAGTSVTSKSLAAASFR